MHCHSPQPIKDASFELAGSIVHVTRSPPQQPTELIYCTASVCIPKRKGEYPHRRRYDCKNRHSTTMHERKGRDSLPFFIPRLGHQKIGPREYSNLFRDRKI